MKYWLMKTEPDTFSIDDLARVKTEAWSGVRNFQARNNMIEMQIGDLVLFYHSSCPVTGVYGVAKVSALAHPDATQFDPKSDYYDARATEEKPLWHCVDVSFVEKFKTAITLEGMKRDAKLTGMELLHKPRLSVQTVSSTHFNHIRMLGTSAGMF